MARPPVGSDNQPRTDTVLYAHIASKLEHVPVKQLGTWVRALGLRAGADAVRRAPRTAARLDRVADRRRAIRPWALVDYRALKLFTAVVRLRLAGPRTVGIRAVAEVCGVVDVLAIEHTKDLLLTVVFESVDDQDALTGVLAEFGKIVEWNPIDTRVPEAAISTFRALARQAAVPERLRASN